MAEQPQTQARRFQLQWNHGGLISMKCDPDPCETDYIWPGETLGNVIVRARNPGADWREETAFASGDIRRVTVTGGQEPTCLAYDYQGVSRGARGIRRFSLRVAFERSEHGLKWTLELRNTTDQPLEIGDIALPLPFNKEFVQDNLANYTRVVGRHAFIAGDGSFIFWQRPNGQGPYLLMTPEPGTKLEYYEQHELDRRGIRVPYWVYLHSGCAGAGETRGSWRQAHTSRTLAPQGQPGDTATYAFRFQWVDDYDAVRHALVDAGLFDVQVVPGMVVPEDMQATLAVRTLRPDVTLEAEFPEQTTIEQLERAPDGSNRYRVTFKRLGENMLTLRWAGERSMPLEFFVTQPIETLIKKRTSFLIEKQQHRSPEKWYDGLFSVWDMRTAELRGPENTDGFDYWWGYVLACDDTALPKAPFIAAKNLYYPNRREIEALEYYIERFVWGKLQRTDVETPLPYAIYGVPNWFENRNHEWTFQSNTDSGGATYLAGGIPAKGKGQEHIWRNFDYPHVMMLYFHMYQIARKYPGLMAYAGAEEYLKRAFGTAKAYFTIQNFLPGWGFWAYTLGIYNELLIVDLIDALHNEGHVEDAHWLQGEWEKKVKYFLYDDPYPFDSEYPFDTTAFESSHAIAKYALTHELQPDENLWHNPDKQRWYSHPNIRREDAEDFLERQMQANIALRGWVEPAYYLLGSDYRGGEGTRYNLSYMSQMGGWAILDYAVHYAKDPFPYLRLGYASYLSSWALMNTGTPESNYGYWYPGPENDGASGWAITPEKYGPTWLLKPNKRGAWFYDGEIELGYAGALRMAATVLADDPLFGRIALGGDLREEEGWSEIIPRDGLRSRFYYVGAQRRITITCEWDGFAADQPLRLRADGKEIRFSLENRGPQPHKTRVTITGLPAGQWAADGVEGEQEGTLAPGAALNLVVALAPGEVPAVALRLHPLENGHVL
jgi:hypothetical protein